MVMINRLARLFKADFHAVLDHIEDPEQQLKQAVREMEAELAQFDSNIAKLQFEKEDLEQRHSCAEQAYHQTSDEIRICFENESEDLARGLIRRKLELTEAIRVIGKQQVRVEKDLTALKKHLSESLSLYEAMQQKVELLSQASASPADFRVPDECAFGIKDSDVEVALLKERQMFAEKSA